MDIRNQHVHIDRVATLKHPNPICRAKVMAVESLFLHLRQISAAHSGHLEPAVATCNSAIPMPIETTKVATCSPGSRLHDELLLDPWGWGWGYER